MREQTVKLAMEGWFTRRGVGGHSPGIRALSMWNRSQERCYWGSCKEHGESKPAAMIQLQMADEGRSSASDDPFTVGPTADHERLEIPLLAVFVGERAAAPFRSPSI